MSKVSEGCLHTTLSWFTYSLFTLPPTRTLTLSLHQGKLSHLCVCRWFMAVYTELCDHNIAILVHSTHQSSVLYPIFVFASITVQICSLSFFCPDVFIYICAGSLATSQQNLSLLRFPLIHAGFCKALWPYCCFHCLTALACLSPIWFSLAPSCVPTLSSTHIQTSWPHLYHTFTLPSSAHLQHPRSCLQNHPLLYRNQPDCLLSPVRVQALFYPNGLPTLRQAANGWHQILLTSFIVQGSDCILLCPVVFT